MATATYVPIATTTLGSAAASITFSSLTTSYTDLRVIVNGTTSASTYIYVRYSGNSTSAYQYAVGYNKSTNDGTLISTYSTSATSAQITPASATSTTIPFLVIHDIFNYQLASSYPKHAMTRFSCDQNSTSSGFDSTGYNYFYVAATAITSIAFSLGSGNFSTGTSATLYGIKAA